MFHASHSEEQPPRTTLTAAVAGTTCVAMLLWMAAAVSASFVTVQTQPGASHVEVVAHGAQTQVSFGLLRSGGELLNLPGDSVWKLCRIVTCVALLVAVLCGGVVGLLVGGQQKPQQRHVLWQTVSLLAAGNAVLGVPVYILLESRPCTDFPLQQSCHFGPAAYVWGIATACWILVAILTQVFDPPPPVVWGKMLWGKDHDGIPRERGLRRWVRLESDHESTSSGGWGPDEEVGLIRGTDPVATTDKTPIPPSQAQEQPLDDRPEELPATITDKTALLMDVEEEAIFEPSGPEVIYQDLEQEAAESVFTGPLEESVLTGPIEDVAKAATPPPSVRYSQDQLQNMPSLIDQEDSEMGWTGAPSTIQPEAALETDLGSLEPSSVEDITGDDSLLDKRSMSLLSSDHDDINKLPSATPSVADDQPLLVTEDPASPQPLPEEATNTRASIADAMKKVVPLPVVDLRRAILGRRKHKKPRGYRLMDDTNLESSLPISPPLEIVTMTMINDAGLDLGEDDPLEEEFEDIWDEMDRMVSPPSKYSQSRPKPAVVEATEAEVVVKKSPRRSRRRKRRRSKRHGSPNSLSSSSGSLLSYTIPEESESDLDDSDEEEDDDSSRSGTFNPYGSPVVEPLPLTKSRSAPNLALFDQMSKAPGRVAEEVQMTGINNTKKRAQVFSTSDSMTRDSSRQDGETSPCSVADFGRHQDHTIVSLPDSPPAKRLPLFRCEREQREGIHSVCGVFSEDSSNEGGKHDLRSLPSFRSVKSYNARVARIRRLQQAGGGSPPNHKSPIRCIGKYPSIPCVSPDDEKKESDSQATYYSGNKQLQQTRCIPQALPPRPPPLNVSSHSRSSGDHTSMSGATLDELNAELAMLLRPDDLMEGPEEGML